MFTTVVRAERKLARQRPPCELQLMIDRLTIQGLLSCNDLLCIIGLQCVTKRLYYVSRHTTYVTSHAQPCDIVPDPGVDYRRTWDAACGVSLPKQVCHPDLAARWP